MRNDSIFTSSTLNFLNNIQPHFTLERIWDNHQIAYEKLGLSLSPSWKSRLAKGSFPVIVPEITYRSLFVRLQRAGMEITISEQPGNLDEFEDSFHNQRRYVAFLDSVKPPLGRKTYRHKELLSLKEAIMARLVYESEQGQPGYFEGHVFCSFATEYDTRQRCKLLFGTNSLSIHPSGRRPRLWMNDILVKVKRNLEC